MLAVGVLIDLKWCPEAGGQVKCWESLAKAAMAFQEEVDLTVHFLGDREEAFIISENVRYITHPPLLSTAWFRFLNRIPEHTDLAPFHPRLFPYLKNYDVIHTTNVSFALAKTAFSFVKRSSTPLVNSIHTDNPRYARLYSAEVIRKLFKDGQLSRLLLDRFRFDERCASFMVRKLDRYLKRCDWVLVSKEEDWERISRVFPKKRISFLRRGIDKGTFHPKWRDRERLYKAFRIPPDRFLLLFVGRVDQGKNVMTLAEAAKILLDRDEPIHVMVVGEGSQKEAIRTHLGPHVTLPGVVPHSTLAWLYASADLFVFPSEIEVCPNVVIEAKASGLPVLVPARGGAAQCLKKQGVDGFILKENSPERWAQAIESLQRSPTRRARMGQEARKHIESEWPSWGEVLANDLIPVWRAVAKERRPTDQPKRTKTKGDGDEDRICP
ncbi:MAG: glycosyltransferase [Candidatus Methylomirabilales bacterium]